jgi:hypothetical protein
MEARLWILIALMDSCGSSARPGRDVRACIEVTTGGGPGIGTWQPTGERIADLTTFSQDLDPSTTGFEPGTVVFRAEVEVDEAGDAATATYSVEGQDPAATLLSESGQLEGSLTRIIEAFFDTLVTPMAATPTS